MNKKFTHYKNKRPYQPKESFTGAKVEVRNGDVNGALRRLKKILENDNRQKELSKREFYEKPSVRKKRAGDQQKKRAQRDRLKKISTGEMPYSPKAGLEYMKSKRKRRQEADLRNIFETLKRKKGGA